MTRKGYTPNKLLVTDKIMASMREIAFGKKSRMKTRDILDRAERMRDDDKLLFLAEEKRLRKAQSRLKNK